MSVIRPEEVNHPVSQFRDRVLPIFRAWKHQLEVEHAGVAITVCDRRSARRRIIKATFWASNAFSATRQHTTRISWFSP